MGRKKKEVEKVTEVKKVSESFWSKLSGKVRSIGTFMRKRKYCIAAIIILCVVIWLIA